jgi:hypothetical protein
MTHRGRPRAPQRREVDFDGGRAVRHEVELDLAGVEAPTLAVEVPPALGLQLRDYMIQPLVELYGG